MNRSLAVVPASVSAAVPARAPPPTLRRRHPLRAEPVVFAVFLTLLTLGINLAGVAPRAGQAEQAESKPAPSRVASAG